MGNEETSDVITDSNEGPKSNESETTDKTTSEDATVPSRRPYFSENDSGGKGKKLSELERINNSNIKSLEGAVSAGTAPTKSDPKEDSPSKADTVPNIGNVSRP